MNSKQIAIIGLGKMGGNLALNLKDKGYKVIAFNRTSSVTDEYVKQGIEGAYSLEELINKLAKPRVVWLMLPSGEATQNMLLGKDGLINLLEKDDIVIEGGNSFYKNDIENAKAFAEKGIKYMDVGVSGGPSGARNGACLMIGGEKKNYEYLKELFKDISVEDGFKFFEGAGAGHFVKMVHNGIEYGIMQSLAEGFNLMKNSDYDLNLIDVADVYNHGSVIESRLMGWMNEGLEKFGVDLKDVSGNVANSGEGRWTVDTAIEKNLPVPVIEDSLQFRLESMDKPSYIGKILMMLRNMFGGHSIN